MLKITRRRALHTAAGLGATVSLFMVPILAVGAAFILRDISRRGSEV